ncbi:polysaccharide deacetylase family protein [Mycetocola spongiae]|uniref:polysaccharide deacetylase family protein n=1 Tax=Mycetocola spongiae TaxID=2859226 RepID=UPI001CF4CA38|nr:polysaccharide deacetylase family protein [Mycetocola spongiae]UCR90100.1 polysaccharide deacetylase family protein [Mycetocola spongiae]
MSRRFTRIFLPILIAIALILGGGVWWFALNSPEGSPATPSASPESSWATRVDAPEPLPEGSIANLDLIQSSTSDQQDQRSVSYVTSSSVPQLSDLIHSFVDAQRAEYDSEAAPAGNSRELNIGWEIASARANNLVERLIGYRYAGGANGIGFSATFHARLDTGEVIPGEDVLSEEGRRTAAEEIRRGLRLGGQLLEADAGTPSASPGATLPAEPPRELFRDTVIEPDGSLIVTLPELVYTPHSEGRPAMRLAADHVDALLSPAGRALRVQAMSGVPFAGLPESPTPEPTRAPAPPAAPVDCAVARCVALTYDDGPGKDTGKLLDELAEAGAPATFFMVGKNAAQKPQTLARAHAEGHEIGGHTWTHPDLRKLSAEQIAGELSDTADAIERAGVPRPTLVRPPYGAINEGVSEVFRQQGAAAIIWNVDTEDWRNHSVEETTRRALDGAKPGAIILMHDIHETSVAAAPGIIAGLRERGFTLVTVSQLLGPTTPGSSYFQRRD